LVLFYPLHPLRLLLQWLLSLRLALSLQLHLWFPLRQLLR
jgi:hypothetical protein